MTDLYMLYQIAERDSIKVDSFDLGSREAISLMDSDNNCYIAIDPFKLSSISDEKTKLAHELGHCETGSFYNVYSDLDVRGKHEHRADKWAFQVLVPKSDLDEAVKTGLTETWELAEYFDVPCEFMQKAITYYHEIDLAG